MIILLYGQDTYRSHRKLDEIVKHYKEIHKGGINLKFLEGKNLKFENFKDEFQQNSIFIEKKFFIVKSVFSNREFKEKFLENVKNFINSNNLILFYEEDEISQDDLFFKLIKKIGKVQEFKPLNEEKLKVWAKREIEGRGGKIELQALEKLIEFIGNDLWQLSNEIEKLINYKNNKIIQTKDIELLVKPKIEVDIFKTIDAISSKNKRRALQLLHKHLKKGDNPLYLISMINFQFRNLLIIKELIEKHQPYYLILKKTQLNPFIVKKSYQQSSKFTFSELKKIYRKIFEVEFSVKTGKVEPEIAIDLLITEI